MAEQRKDQATDETIAASASAGIANTVAASPAIGNANTVAAGSVSAVESAETVGVASIDAAATLETLAASSPTAGHTTPIIRAGGAPAGGRLGRYVLLGELGRGGMGVVYSAFDPELDRKIALKVLKPGTSADAADAAARLQREGRAIAKLAHPNVVTVFDVGTEGGNVFVAMELVDGGSLDRWLVAEPRSWREVLDVFLQAGEGLAAAHAAGMIHRDFKPANVLIGKDGRARVTDFGLARPASRDDGGAPVPRSRESGLDLTQTGAILGTPAYMPPEQFDAAPLDARSDQFSFAVSLYEGLHGERPFKGATIGEIYDAIASATIVAPARSPVPAWLRTVVLRGLASKPELRYPTLEAMLGELRRDPGARRRVLLGVAAAVVLVAAGVGVLATTQSVEDPCAHAGDQIAEVWTAARGKALRERLVGTKRSYAAALADNVIARFDAHGARWQRARKEACVATRRRGERSEELLDRRMICLDRNLGELRARVETLEAGEPASIIDKAVDVALRIAPVERCADDEALLAAVPPPSDPIVRARSVGLDEKLARASALNDLGRWTEGLALANTALAEIRTLDHPGQLARGLCVTADLETRVSDLAGAERDFLACATTAARAHDDGVQTSGLIGLLGVVGVYRGLHKEALRIANVAEATLIRAGDRPDLRAKLRHTHGIVVEQSGEVEAAYSLYEEAHKIWSSPGPARNDANALHALGSLGAVRYEQGRYPEAYALLERTWRERETLLGREHPLVVDSLQNVALVLADQGKREEALKLYEDALARGEKAFGPEHPSVARIIANMAVTLGALGRERESMVLERRALAIREAALGPEHADVASNLSNIAHSLAEIGDYAEAIATYERAGKIDEKIYGADHVQLAYTHAGIARVLFKQDKHEEALHRFERALALRETAQGPTHPDVASALASIGTIEMTLNRLDDAELHLRRSLAIREERLGPTHPELGYDLCALAGVVAKRGKFIDALPLAERCLRIRVDGKVAASSIAEAKYYVGQAMWGAKRDRARALALVAEARAVYAAAGKGEEAGVREVDRWMKTKKP